MAWSICPAPVDGSEAAASLRAYLVDIVGRYHGRPATPAEVDEAVAAAADDRLRPPHGQFLIARDPGPGAAPTAGQQAGGCREGTVVGCAGVRLLSPKVAELKRVWVRPDARGRGLGAGLLAAAEEAAAGLGATTVRLDTRSDLTEARRLYARHGYVEIAPYHHDPYAEHFFEKRLD